MHSKRTLLYATLGIGILLSGGFVIKLWMIARLHYAYTDGVAYYKQGNYERAIDELSYLVERWPLRPAKYYLGCAQLKNAKQKAIQEWTYIVERTRADAPEVSKAKKELERIQQWNVDEFCRE